MMILSLISDQHQRKTGRKDVKVAFSMNYEDQANRILMFIYPIYIRAHLKVNHIDGRRKSRLRFGAAKELRIEGYYHPKLC